MYFVFADNPMMRLLAKMKDRAVPLYLVFEYPPEESVTTRASWFWL